MVEKKRVVTIEEVRAFINDVWAQIGPQLSSFNGERIKGIQKLEIEGKILFKFAVESSIGPLHCLYEPEELVSSLLSENEYHAAFNWFVLLLNKFPLSLLVSAENAGKTAALKSVELSQAYQLVKDKGKKGTPKKALRERRKATLEEMKQGNEMLVGANTPGPEQTVTPYTIGIAIEVLKKEGKSPDDITPDTIGMYIGCSGGAVSKYFERHGGSLREMISRSFDGDN